MKYLSALCACLVITGVSVASAQTAPVTVTRSYNGFPVFIPIDDADVISIASITVPEAIKMTKVTVRVNVQYPHVGDLNLFLYSPDGTRAKLLERNCGSLRNVITTFDDSAPSEYADFCPVEPGRGPFRANEPLSNFNEADSSLGVWYLAVENNGSDDRAGWLNSFTLEISGTSQLPPTFRSDTILNTASVRGGVIAPGENVSFLGIGLGPQDGVTAPIGTRPTSLAGVRVSINGFDIPLSYVSHYRIDAQVPYGITAPGTATVRVHYNDLLSSTITVNTQSTFPGIYTKDQTGAGPAAALNSDGSVNSKTNPAPKGGALAILASGLGAVNPPVQAGEAAGADPASVVSETVAASIGGVPVRVIAARLMPGQAGFYQVVLEVPRVLPGGTRAVVISNAGNASQAEVTVEIE